MTYKPNKVTVDSSKKRLLIQWEDGHASQYPFGGLRSNCPCVFCQGGHDGMGKPMDPIKFFADENENLEIKNIQVVGNYAFQVFWSDGHNSGIYRFDYLRDGCPVEAGVLEAP